MITLRDSSIQRQISLLFQLDRSYTISANDPKLMMLVDYDLAEAERQLNIWISNHEDDCCIIGKNPLSIKIFPTFFNDPEQRLQHDAFVARRKRRYGR
ncbi:hypothetical protein ApAK_01955 [Thermoplasmatales archaeon AK]|nr:hypothetical protein [Thermoplasmatales archaeon AK]